MLAVGCHALWTLVSIANVHASQCQCLEQLAIGQLSILLVGWFTPPLPWDGGTAQTAIQVHAINLIKFG